MGTSSLAKRTTSYSVVAFIATIAVAMSLSGSHRTATGPTEHNARVAEYLLLHNLDKSEHNARVAEYLLLQR